MKRGQFVILLVIAAVIGVFAFVTYATQQARVNDFSRQLRDGLVASCEKNGNPLRAGVTQMLQDQIAQSEAGLKSGQYARFFPNIPEDELRALIEEQNAKRREIIEQIRPVDCADTFPKP